MRYLLGFDIGSSSVKASMLNVQTGKTSASASSPAEEMKIDAPREGWAEQNPETWMAELVNAIRMLRQKLPFDASDVAAIGIAYQMHGLVLADRAGAVLRPAIIWCDSRAVSIGDKAFQELGAEYCLGSLLNSPGNFTASKLRWVKENEPRIFEKVHKILLPGDYIALRLTGEFQTTISGLSEGVLWDFKNKKPADRLSDYYGFPPSLTPDIVDTFSVQGELTRAAADLLGLKAGTLVAYRAGDQPNNAFSLGVLEPGEVAATAGTSGVVYGVTESAAFDPQSRVNTFAHVNYTKERPRNGVLLCINGTGILNSWLRRNAGAGNYDAMNAQAAQAPIGSDGLTFLPFGNGAERILNNRQLSASMQGLQLTRHDQSHLFRAAQEGIVFALQYGLEIMKEMGVGVSTVRAGYGNMFLSPVFREAFANTTGASLELYETDGAAGAARGAGVGAGVFKNMGEAFHGLEKIGVVEPDKILHTAYAEACGRWEKILEGALTKGGN